MKFKKVTALTLVIFLILTILQSATFANDLDDVPYALDNTMVGNLKVSSQASSKDYDNLHAHAGDEILEDYSYRLEIEPTINGYGYTYLDIENEFEDNFSYNDYSSNLTSPTLYKSTNFPKSLLVDKNLSFLIFIKTDQVFIQDSVGRVTGQEGLDPDDNERYGAYFSTLNNKGIREFADTFVSGTTDWTLVRIDVDPLDYFYPYDNNPDYGDLKLNPVLHLGNPVNLTIGTAWFDLSLIQLTENKPLISDDSEYGFYKEATDLYLQGNSGNEILLNYTIPPRYDNSNYLITFEENNNKDKVFYLDIQDNPDADNLIVTYKPGIPLQSAITSVTLNIKDKTTDQIVFTDIILINIYNSETVLTVSPTEVHLDLSATELSYHSQQLLVNPFTTDVRFTSSNPSVAVINNYGEEDPGLIRGVGPGIATIYVTLGSQVVEVTVYVNQADIALNSSYQMDIDEAYNNYLNDITDDENLFALKEHQLTDKEVAYKVVNFIRVASGLKPITGNKTYESYAQAGLDFLAKSNLEISHTAARNSGNTTADLGLSNSNLTSRSGNNNLTYDPSEMIYAFLIDSGQNNLFKAGHRRWLLNDLCEKMGFAEATSANKETIYGALYVLDDNGKEANVTTFPSAGDYPLELISDFYDGNFTWSIMFGDKYTLDPDQTINVSIKRVSDGKTVNYSRASESQVKENTDWYSVVTEIVGNGQGININPASFINGSVENLLDETYQVSISGPGINGVSSSLNYSVHFYSMKGERADEVEATDISIDQKRVTINKGDNTKLSITLTPVNATPELKWISRNSSIARVNENGVVTAVSVGETEVLVQTENELSSMVTINVIDPTQTIEADTIDVPVDEITLLQGQKWPLIANTDPVESNESILWNVDNSSIASLSEGLLIANSPGTTTLTAKTAQSGKEDKVKVTVVSTADQVLPTGVEVLIPQKRYLVDGVKPILYTGGTSQLSYKFEPSNATDVVSWFSTTPSVATVSEDGKITAVSPGTTTISVNTANGQSSSFILTVQDKITYVSHIDTDVDTLTLAPGDSYTINTGISPSSATDKTLLFSSENSRIVSVNDKGTVKALRSGITTINVDSADGGASASVEVAVSSNSGDETKAPTEGTNRPNTNNNNNNNQNSGTNSNNNNTGTNVTSPSNSTNNGSTNTVTPTTSGSNNTSTTRTTTTNRTTGSGSNTTTSTTNPKTGVNEDMILIALILLFVSSAVLSYSYYTHKE